MWLHTGLYRHCKSLHWTEVDWEKNPLPHQELDPVSVLCLAFQSDAPPTELSSPHAEVINTDRSPTLQGGSTGNLVQLFTSFPRVAVYFPRETVIIKAEGQLDMPENRAPSSHEDKSDGVGGLVKSAQSSVALVHSCVNFSDGTATGAMLCHWGLGNSWACSLSGASLFNLKKNVGRIKEYLTWPRACWSLCCHVSKWLFQKIL